MDNKIRNSLYPALFLVAALAGAAKAQEFVCGTPDDVAGLAKAADLPKITKRWAGKPKALMIRIGFSDAPYSTDTAAINKTHAAINTLYRSMSRNTFEWDFRIYEEIFAAPGTKAGYGSNFNSLQSWITSQITAKGLKRGIDYDVYIAHFPQISVGWAGLSNLRDADWINGNYSSGVTAHELGHSVALPHSHSIEAGTDMFGTPGTSSQTNEYGNPFDVMGRGGINGHFNVMYKWRVGWIDSNEVIEVKATGTYRIYAMDNGIHKERLIGIRVPSGNPAYGYWFEYRAVNTSAQKGATVAFQGFNGSNNMDQWYMDMTPGSKTSGDEQDGILAPGKEFKDKYGALTFQTVAINTGTYNENGWVDVLVTIPGTSKILARNTNLLRRGLDGNSDAFSLLGRSMRGLSSAQALVVHGQDGAGSRLVLQAR
jgi:hypothetical protein